jgi:hypothetical protein
MIEITLKVKKVGVLTGVSGTDTVFLHTELPSGCYREEGVRYPDGATFRTDVASGEGAKWVREFLGVEPEIMDLGKR